jgi:hypothetical protein
MRITVAIGFDLALAANGILMLFDPAGWYAVAPGVPETRPLNPHFVRDIGCAYILTGSALAGLAFNERAWPAALIGAPDAACARSRRRRFLRPGTREPCPHRPRRRVCAGRGRSLACPFIHPHLSEAITIMSTRP